MKRKFKRGLALFLAVAMISGLFLSNNGTFLLATGGDQTEAVQEAQDGTGQEPVVEQKELVIPNQEEPAEPEAPAAAEEPAEPAAEPESPAGSEPAADAGAGESTPAAEGTTSESVPEESTIPAEGTVPAESSEPCPRSSSFDTIWCTQAVPLPPPKCSTGMILALRIIVHPPFSFMLIV